MTALKEGLVKMMGLVRDSDTRVGSFERSLAKVSAAEKRVEMLSEACQRQSELVDFEFAELRKKLNECDGKVERMASCTPELRKMIVEARASSQRLTSSLQRRSQDAFAEIRASPTPGEEPKLPANGLTEKGDWHEVLKFSDGMRKMERQHSCDGWKDRKVSEMDGELNWEDLVGSTVALKELRMSEMNGELGTVVSWSAATGRFGVTLHNGSLKALRPANLEVVYASSPASSAVMGSSSLLDRVREGRLAEGAR